MNRRDFLISSSALLAACIDTSAPGIDSGNEHLTSRPRTPTNTGPTGRSALGIGIDRDGFIYVPTNYSASTPASLVILLHGAGRSALEWGSTLLNPLFDQRNIIALAPDSRGASWDLRLTGYGADVEFIDVALNKVFSTYAVNPDSIALAGFSDGASYALSLGLSSGDLFNAVMGFSPGFYEPGKLRGKPKVFLTHGTADTVLPFSWTSGTLKPQLISQGYAVRFEQFDGGHNVPLELFTASLDWWLS